MLLIFVFQLRLCIYCNKYTSLSLAVSLPLLMVIHTLRSWYRYNGNSRTLCMQCIEKNSCLQKSALLTSQKAGWCFPLYWFCIWQLLLRCSFIQGSENIKQTPQGCTTGCSGDLDCVIGVTMLVVDKVTALILLFWHTYCTDNFPVIVELLALHYSVLIDRHTFVMDLQPVKPESSMKSWLSTMKPFCLMLTEYKCMSSAPIGALPCQLSCDGPLAHSAGKIVSLHQVDASLKSWLMFVLAVSGGCNGVMSADVVQPHVVHALFCGHFRSPSKNPEKPPQTCANTPCKNMYIKGLALTHYNITFYSYENIRQWCYIWEWSLSLIQIKIHLKKLSNNPKLQYYTIQ